MENKSDKGGFWRRQSFLLPPLTAAVVLLCQQMASSNPSGVVTVNILLLVLNFFSYVGLLRGEKSTEKSVAIAAAGFITLMAFVFNTCVAGIPTPLSDTGIFMNSLCGMWVLVAVVQGISLLIQAVLQPTVEQETGASETNVWNRLQKVGGQLKPKATNSQEIILMLLRLATVLLAIVSWWSTAQGMRDYVFSQAWQANLASFAIQSILLGLNFYLPTSGAGYIVCAGKSACWRSAAWSCSAPRGSAMFLSLARSMKKAGRPKAACWFSPCTETNYTKRMNLYKSAVMHCGKPWATRWRLCTLPARPPIPKQHRILPAWI